MDSVCAMIQNPPGLLNTHRSFLHIPNFRGNTNWVLMFIFSEITLVDKKIEWGIYFHFKNLFSAILNQRMRVGLAGCWCCFVSVVPGRGGAGYWNVLGRNVFNCLHTVPNLSSFLGKCFRFTFVEKCFFESLLKNCLPLILKSCSFYSGLPQSKKVSNQANDSLILWQGRGWGGKYFKRILEIPILL